MILIVNATLYKIVTFVAWSIFNSYTNTQIPALKSVLSESVRMVRNFRALRSICLPGIPLLALRCLIFHAFSIRLMIRTIINALRQSFDSFVNTVLKRMKRIPRIQPVARSLAVTSWRHFKSQTTTLIRVIQRHLFSRRAPWWQV